MHEVCFLQIITIAIFICILPRAIQYVICPSFPLLKFHSVYTFTSHICFGALQHLSLSLHTILSNYCKCEYRFILQQLCTIVQEKFTVGYFHVKIVQPSICYLQVYIQALHTHTHTHIYIYIYILYIQSYSFQLRIMVLQDGSIYIVLQMASREQ